MYMLKKIIFFYFLFIFCNISYASDIKSFLMLKNNKVYVRYGPSKDYPIKYIYRKINLPIEVIDRKENFRKIIDHKKNSGWIHISQLKKSVAIIVLEDKLLFKKASKFSEPIVKLKKGRLVKIKKCISDWCKVKADKYLGWIDINNVWGRY